MSHAVVSSLHSMRTWYEPPGGRLATFHGHSPVEAGASIVQLDHVSP